jgi:sulfite exporter TauE/SafE
VSITFAATALLMGLAGGPHCVAMCGAACGAIARAGATRSPRAMWSFQLGRLAGYAAAGAVAGGAVQAVAWLTTQAGALRPVWTLFHLGVLAWGLMLATRARQPLWASAVGRAAWQQIRPLAAARGGVFAAGALWAFMPCGLLYSALLVASLSGGALQGAAAMALFAVGSGAALLAAPRVLLHLQRSGNALRQDAGTRLAGALLVAAAAWALWMDLADRIALWCGIA